MRNFALLLAMTLGLPACRDEAPSAAGEPPATAPAHVLQTQTDALDKARAVEEQLQQAARQRDQQLNETSGD